MSATVSLYLDTRRQKKNGTYPVKLRITFQRKQEYYPTGLDLTLAEWEKVGKPKPREEYIKETKRLLDVMCERAERVISNLPLFDFALFEERYKGSTSTLSDDVFAYFESYIKQANGEGRAGSAASYDCAANSLRDFHGRKAPLSFKEISPQWLKEYERWMLSKSKSVTTVGIYLRNLRALFNQAIEDGIVNRDTYPFGKRRYQIPVGRNIKKALTLSDIQKIYYASVEAGSMEDRARDFWLLSYLCNGMNMKDLCRMRYEQVQETYIAFDRAKTARTKRDAKPITVVLTDDIRQIIAKWGQKPVQPKRYVFDIFEPGMSPEREMAVGKQFIKQVNKYVRRIAEREGIEKDITTYTARHSYATVLKRSGASIEFISESLGHGNHHTTQSYLDSFEDEVKEQFAKALTSFKKSPQTQDLEEA